MKHAIDPEVLKHHTAILGKTGSGKTSTSKLAVEQVVADDFRVCVLDPIKSDWWGITSSASGKAPGLPFKILGGPRGHVALHSSAGKVIGHLVGSGKLPLSVLDMADFEAGGLQRFFVDFVPALMRSAKGVLYLVIEEAHEFAPKERAGFGAENMAIHFAKKLATAGRSKGVRLILATQRVQSLHNALLGSCESIIAHRLTTPADQEPVLKWLRSNTTKEEAAGIASSISSLKTGEAWICSGEARIFDKKKFPMFKTYDNAATPISDADEVTVKTATVDQDELRALIGVAVQEAEANDPKKLQEQIRKLQGELAAKPAAPAAPTTVPDPDAEARGYRAGVAVTLAAFETFATATVERLKAHERVRHEVDASWRAISPDVFADAFADVAKDVQHKLPVLANFIPDKTPRVVKGGIVPAYDNTPRPAPQDGAMPPVVRKILDEVHRVYPIGLTFEAAAMRAGVSKRSSAYNSYRKHFNSSPELERRQDGRCVSAPGYRQELPPGRDPVEMFAERLPPSWAAMLRAIAASGGPITRPEIAKAAGVSITSSGLSAGINELEALGLVEKAGDTCTLHGDLR